MRIDTKRGRGALDIRPAPYFEKLAKGRGLGFRKLSEDRGTWVARYTSEEGRAADGKLKLNHANKSLAEWSPTFDYDQAVDVGGQQDHGYQPHDDPAAGWPFGQYVGERAIGQIAVGVNVVSLSDCGALQIMKTRKTYASNIF